MPPETPADLASLPLPPVSPHPDNLPHVVGVGASAGGLAALIALLSRLPSNPGFAVIVVTHLDPTHESSLAEILGKSTSMPVVTATNGLRVDADHVYVIAPNTNLRLRKGLLSIEPRVADEGRSVPIDTLFCSLAEAGPGVAGVVLSGTGSDGAQGVLAIRGAGGITFAQDGSAGYPGMPQAAIGTGCVDYVLAPEDIALELLRVWPRGGGVEARKVDEEALLQTIFERLRTTSRLDFSHYKRSSFLRRVHRRAQLRHARSLGEYVELLSADSAEATALGEDALIHVTSFFRDPEVFEALKTTVFPRLIERRSRDAPLRVWVPGCSSGEEVYSIAICLLEYLSEVGLELPIKLFGTDIGQAAIERARAGCYSDEIASEVSSARLERFFVPIEGGHQIRRDVRDLCVFARHDVTRDPPFSGVDLVSCRNLLIYLDAALQGRVLPVFHYALRDGGFLLLGGAEGVGASPGFSTVDQRNRIYARTGAPSRLVRELHPWAELASSSRQSAATPGHNDIHREADRVVLVEHGPPGVVVTEDLSIVQFRGQTGPYMEHSEGPASLDLLHVAREDLRFTLRRVLYESKRTGAVARAIASEVGETGLEPSVEVEAIPFRVAASQQQLYVVLFRDIPAPPSVPAISGETSSSDAARAAIELGLRRELASTREYLQSVVEQLEASNEELRAANQEIISSNEELHSTNEELQTAKEELQAINEELTTVNGELLERNIEATRFSDDLSNILASIGIPFVILRRDGRVRRFTAAAGRALGLVAADVGQPFIAARSRLHSTEIERAIDAVQESLIPQEITVRDEDGRWRLASVRPYLTVDNRVDGITLALFDIDAIKRGELALLEARDYSEAIIATIHEGLLVLEDDLRVLSANRSFYSLFAASPKETEGKMLQQICGGCWNVPALVDALTKLLRSDEAEEVRDLRIDQEIPQIGRRTMLLNGRRMRNAHAGAPRILLAIEDVTERLRVIEASRERDRGFRQMLTSAAEPIVIVGAAQKVTFANDIAHRTFGYAPDEMLGLELRELIPEEARDQHAVYHRMFMAAPSARPMGKGMSINARRKDGSTFPVEIALAMMNSIDGPSAVAFISDISRRRAEEAQTRDYNAQLQRLAFELQATEERERRRLAADLHDQIGQTLALLQIRLTKLRPELEGDTIRELDECVELVSTTIEDTRTLVFELSPPILYDLGLVAAIGWLAELFTARHGVHVTVDGATAVALDVDLAAVLFRAVRELLTNVVKHAKIAEARVTILDAADRVEIVVADLGVGFVAEPAGRGRGFGLFSVGEQITRLNGAVEVTSTPNQGTQVKLRIPKRPSEAPTATQGVP